MKTLALVLPILCAASFTTTSCTKLENAAPSALITTTTTSTALFGSYDVFETCDGSNAPSYKISIEQAPPLTTIPTVFGSENGVPVTTPPNINDTLNPDALLLRNLVVSYLDGGVSTLVSAVRATNQGTHFVIESQAIESNAIKGTISGNGTMNAGNLIITYTVNLTDQSKAHSCYMECKKL